MVSKTSIFFMMWGIKITNTFSNFHFNQSSNFPFEKATTAVAVHHSMLCRLSRGNLLAWYIAVPEFCCNPKCFGTAMCQACNVLRQQCVAVPKTCGLQQFFSTTVHCWRTCCTRGAHHACTLYATSAICTLQCVKVVHNTLHLQKGVNKVQCTCSVTVCAGRSARCLYGVHCTWTPRCSYHALCTL